jgi:NADPH-dependent F420 reductase
MKIAVIGAGNVGKALGTGWAARGHDVVFGVRDPESEKSRAAREAGGRLASIGDAAKDAEVVVLATPWGGTEEAIRAAGDLTGKIVADCTNPLGPNFSLTVGHTTSGGETVAGWAKGARVVKAFNNTGSGNMENPAYGDQRAAMLICGDDQEARNTVLQLARDLGFDAVDSGPLANARLLEPLAALWIWLAYGGGLGRNIAFVLAHR